MINHVVLVGRLTKDPELRYTPSGIPMTRFTVAVNRAFTNQQGDRDADFISCIAWRKQAENLANYMRKGSLIGLEGRIQTSSFEGQDGKRIYTTDVVADSIQFLERRNAATGANASNQPYGEQLYNGNQPTYNTSQPNQEFGNISSNTSQNSFPSYPQDYSSGNQHNYSRVDEDPFSSSKSPIEVAEDDLPF